MRTNTICDTPTMNTASQEKTFLYKGAALVIWGVATLVFLLSTFYRSLFNQYLPSYSYYALSLVSWGAFLYFACRAQWKHRMAMWASLAIATLSMALYPTVFAKFCSPYHWHHIYLTDSLLYRVETEAPLVALTFDDGPIEGKTEQLLEVLAKHKAHATFFMVGQNILSNASLVKRIVEQGHSIGNHTWDHTRLDELNDENYIQGLRETSEAIASVAGVSEIMMRPPGGIMDPHQGWIAAKKQRLPICMWSLQSNDTVYPKETHTTTIVPHLMKSVKPGDIILMHDHSISPEILDALLFALEKRGLKGVSVPELTAAKNAPLN